MKYSVVSKLITHNFSSRSRTHFFHFKDKTKTNSPLHHTEAEPRAHATQLACPLHMGSFCTKSKLELFYELQKLSSWPLRIGGKSNLVHSTAVYRGRWSNCRWGFRPQSLGELLINQCLIAAPTAASLTRVWIKQKQRCATVPAVARFPNEKHGTVFPEECYKVI